MLAELLEMKHKDNKSNPHSALQTSIKQSIIEYTHRSKHNTKVNTENPKRLMKSKSSSDIISEKFSKYDTSKMLYKISNEYSKVNFSNEKDFINRMMLYAAKKELKVSKINDIVNSNKTHMSECERISVFNRLIKDSNRRAIMKERVSKCKEDERPKSSLVNRSMVFDQNKWNKIYNERFMSKLKEKEEEVKTMRMEIKKKEEEELKEQMKILNEKNKKIHSDIELKEITNRLYYTPYYKKQGKSILNTNTLLDNNDVILKSNGKKKKEQIPINHKRNKSHTRVEKLIDDFFESKL